MCMKRTYGQLADNIKDLDDFENRVLNNLSLIGIPITSKIKLQIKTSNQTLFRMIIPIKIRQTQIIQLLNQKKPQNQGKLLSQKTE